MQAPDPCRRFARMSRHEFPRVAPSLSTGTPLAVTDGWPPLAPTAGRKTLRSPNLSVTTVRTTWEDLLWELHDAAAELVENEVEREVLILATIRDLQTRTRPASIGQAA